MSQEQRWAIRCRDDGQVVNAEQENLKHVVIPRDVDRSTGQTLQQSVVEHREKAATPLPTTNASSSNSDMNSLNRTVLDSFYKRMKVGAVVFYGQTYMLAVESYGPYSARGIESEMVFVDKDLKALAVSMQRGCASAKELGRIFLLGESVECIEARN